MIVCADVLEWAAGYDGPKFHALLWSVASAIRWQLWQSVTRLRR